MKREIVVVLFLVFFVQFSSAAHYISGYVNDALDGESANGKIVTLWNYTAGQSDNLTDIVGVTGNSGVSNVYLIDCEMLNGGCSVGDILSLKIFGTNYITEIVNVTVSSAGYDAVPNLTLNSPPTAILNYPVNFGNVSENVDFNCSYNDHDENIVRVALWGDWLGGWQEIESRNLGPNSGSVIFSKILTQDNYKWNCQVEDELGVMDFSFSNNSFFVDTTAPVINFVTPESLDVCGYGSIEVNCSAYDENLTIGSVIIESISPTNDKVNYSASFVSGNIYRSNVLVNSIGDWNFTCFTNDSVGNMNSLTSDSVEVLSGNAELLFTSGIVNFDKTPTAENEVINVSVTLENIGCGVAKNLIVGFFDGEKFSGFNFDNKTVSIGAKSTINVSALFSTKIGISNIFVYADLEDSITEDNESNNEANNSLYLKSWQKVFGNLSVDKILMGDGINMNFWSGETSFNGNVFIADTESQIEWTQLQAIGRTKTDAVSSDDFSELDNFLGMNQYNDSIYDLFTDAGSPKTLSNLNVFKRDINNVAIVNTSVSGNFATGILWDMSDSANAEYDSVEGEDVVFVTQINRGAVGEFGVYDYELEVPAKLRSYDDGEESEIYLYYDLN